MAASSSNRFASLNDAEFEKILRDRDADNTKKATKTAVGLFRAYLVAKNQSSEFEKPDKASLAASLSKFYLEARKEDGDFYKTNIRCPASAPE